MLVFVLVHDFLFTSARSNQHHYLYPHDQHRFPYLYHYGPITQLLWGCIASIQVILIFILNPWNLVYIICSQLFA